MLVGQDSHTLVHITFKDVSRTSKVEGTSHYLMVQTLINHCLNGLTHLTQLSVYTNDLLLQFRHVTLS